MRLIFWLTYFILIPFSYFLTKLDPLFWVFFGFVFMTFIVGVVDLFQKKHAIKSNFPVLGRLRYVFEALRPKIYQYFIESDIDGRPINRLNRAVVYQRAKHVRDTVPFGTQLDVYAEGHEWINHSVNALNYNELNTNPRFIIGNEQCSQPYDSSRFNISAMSYGSLSKNAVLALNKGAKLGNFAQNTGEGGVAPYHLMHEGDLIWQIGTGYFGCRKENGEFCEEMYKDNALKKSVKMIELKLSQGAKPGHGGILPASKNNEEISKIRGVVKGTDVLSPPRHSAFNGFDELTEFIKKLRDLSGGKPVGVKLCLGDKSEFVEMIQAFISKNIFPDFIAIDGAEGGTGAAPLEFADRIGAPLIDSLVYVSDILRGLGVKKHIKIIASGKAFNGYDVLKLIALGADGVSSARGMMLALGCIQALECNTNHCPTGITTHKPGLVKGLDVDDKAKRVHSYHKETMHAFVEILGAAGFQDVEKLSRAHLNKRIDEFVVQTYGEIFPEIQNGEFLEKVPERYHRYF